LKAVCSATGFPEAINGMILLFYQKLQKKNSRYISVISIELLRSCRRLLFGIERFFCYDFVKRLVKSNSMY